MKDRKTNPEEEFLSSDHSSVFSCIFIELMLFFKLDGDPKTQKGGSSDRADRDGHIRDGWEGGFCLPQISPLL